MSTEDLARESGFTAYIAKLPDGGGWNASLHRRDGPDTHDGTVAATGHGNSPTRAVRAAFMRIGL